MTQLLELWCFKCGKNREDEGACKSEFIEIGGKSALICKKCKEREDEENKKENQQKVLNWINDEFSLSVDRGGNLINPIEYDEQGDILAFGKVNVENFETIFQAIRNYTTSNSQQFRLGNDTMDESPHLNDGEPPQWWSHPVNTADHQRIPGTNLVTFLLAGTNGRSRTRKILHESGNSFHPAAFTQEQFEKLKNLIPNSCKTRGCYMVYADPYVDGSIQGNTYKATNGVCLYHQAMERSISRRNRRENNNQQQRVLTPTRTTRVSRPFITTQYSSVRNLELQGFNDANVNLDGLNNLERVKFLESSFANLNFSNLPNLKEIELHDSSMANLSIYKLPNLKEMRLFANNMANIDIIKCPKLERVYLDSNNFVNINIQNEHYSFIEVPSKCILENPTR